MKARGEATRRATLLIAQLRAYRQRFGRYPDSLDAFGGADFTTDPYTGASFAYRRDGDDFVLYSLGHNGVDDGGQPDENDSFGGDLRIWPRPTEQ
ncbi:MAG: hypothetical protein D6744_08615 [Planctomycetota bacterium]|nr:MAG: hypothetical protein D6744_08615 [Planctomycetota bacterium]